MLSRTRKNPNKPKPKYGSMHENCDETLSVFFPTLINDTGNEVIKVVIPYFLEEFCGNFNYFYQKKAINTENHESAPS